MTGEITLTGQVLPIGGLKEKALAAQRDGMRSVIAPALNEADVEEMPEHLRQDLEFVLRPRSRRGARGRARSGRVRGPTGRVYARPKPDKRPEGSENGSEEEGCEGRGSRSARRQEQPVRPAPHPGRGAARQRRVGVRVRAGRLRAAAERQGAGEGAPRRQEVPEGRSRTRRTRSRDASAALREGPKKKQKRGAAASCCCSSSAPALALALSEGLRNKVLDAAVRRRGGVRLHARRPRRPTAAAGGRRLPGRELRTVRGRPRGALVVLEADPPTAPDATAATAAPANAARAARGDKAQRIVDAMRRASPARRRGLDVRPRRARGRRLARAAALLLRHQGAAARRGRAARLRPADGGARAAAGRRAQTADDFIDLLAQPQETGRARTPSSSRSSSSCSRSRGATPTSPPSTPS